MARYGVGVTIFELARFMDTSVKVIDETYGHLVATRSNAYGPHLKRGPA